MKISFIIIFVAMIIFGLGFVVAALLAHFDVEIPLVKKKDGDTSSSSG
jgi:sulfite exporter TauE/SafE